MEFSSIKYENSLKYCYNFCTCILMKQSNFITDDIPFKSYIMATQTNNITT